MDVLGTIALLAIIGLVAFVAGVENRQELTSGTSREPRS